MSDFVYNTSPEMEMNLSKIKAFTNSRNWRAPLAFEFKIEKTFIDGICKSVLHQQYRTSCNGFSEIKINLSKS